MEMADKLDKDFDDQDPVALLLLLTRLNSIVSGITGENLVNDLLSLERTYSMQSAESNTR